MNDHRFPMPSLPKVGSEHIKLKSGQIRLWSSFDPNTQIFDYVEADGKVVSVHRRDVEIPTANEVVEFVNSRKSKAD
jgi:hypothetical protein